MHMDVESRRTVRLPGFFTGVKKPLARCEDVIFVTSTFHMSMEQGKARQGKARQGLSLTSYTTCTYIAHEYMLSGAALEERVGVVGRQYVVR